MLRETQVFYKFLRQSSGLGHESILMIYDQTIQEL